jgi:hypothetical protein
MMPAWWPHLWQDDDRFFMMVRHGVLKLPGLDGLTFAIENDIGKAVLAAFLDNQDDGTRRALGAEPIDIAPLDLDADEGRRDRRDDGDGATLPTAHIALSVL